MIQKVDKTLLDLQELHKRYFDRKVRFTPTLKMGQMLYIDKKPPYKKSEAEKLAGEVRTKLLTNTDGIHKRMNETEDTVGIEWNVEDNKIRGVTDGSW